MLATPKFAQLPAFHYKAGVYIQNRAADWALWCLGHGAEQKTGLALIEQVQAFPFAWAVWSADKRAADLVYTLPFLEEKVGRVIQDLVDGPTFLEMPPIVAACAAYTQQFLLLRDNGQAYVVAQSISHLDTLRAMMQNIKP